MKYGICQVVVAPARSDKSDAAEIKCQLLFGDLFEVIETQNNWSYISVTKYEYKAWIDTKHIFFLQELEYHSINKGQEIRVADICSIAKDEDNNNIFLIRGNILPNYNEMTKTFGFGNKIFYFFGNTNKNFTKSKNQIIKTAMEYLNSPYLWGGNSPFGIDCSGLTQVCYELYGIQILRDAWQQETQGNLIDLDNAQAGDLAFFDNENSKVIHVGILIGNNKIIHASGHVRIDIIDKKGIYREDYQKYTHKLCSVKSFF